jgi:N-acetylneuraminic acid mutarotase
LLGGLDATDTSTAGIEIANLHGVTRNASLPIAQHDAQAAALGGTVYVFGGGSYSELDHIVSFDPANGAIGAAGSLPSAQSDVAVAQLDGRAYVVGGFDGTSWKNTILAWRPGAQVKVVAQLPVGLRYAAVAAAAGRLIIIGGSTPVRASDAIYSFDPATEQLRRIGRLPQPITHGGAATIGSTVYLVGGRGDALDAQTARVWAIDPLTGAVHGAGRLPQPLSDAGVVAVGGGIVVAGGLTRSAATLADVGELVPIHGR